MLVGDVALDVLAVDEIGHNALHLIQVHVYLLPYQSRLEKNCTHNRHFKLL
jgi:hypothetical protein